MSRSPFRTLIFIGSALGTIMLLAPLFIPSFYQQIVTSIGLNFYFLVALACLAFYMGVVVMIRFMTGW